MSATTFRTATRRVSGDPNSLRPCRIARHSSLDQRCPFHVLEVAGPDPVQIEAGPQVAVSIASSIWTILTLAYAHGGINTDGFFFGWGARYPFENASARIQSLEGPHWENWGFAGIGAAAMGLLMLARQRFLWWPLHPLGLPLSAVFSSAFFSVFLGWLFKTAIVKYGGVKLYVATRPFFIGVILG